MEFRSRQREKGFLPPVPNESVLRAYDWDTRDGDHMLGQKRSVGSSCRVRRSFVPVPCSISSTEDQNPQTTDNPLTRSLTHSLAHSLTHSASRRSCLQSPTGTKRGVSLGVASGGVKSVKARRRCLICEASLPPNGGRRCNECQTYRSRRGVDRPRKKDAPWWYRFSRADLCRLCRERGVVPGVAGPGKRLVGAGLALRF